jgi:hypothetical protein
MAQGLVATIQRHKEGYTLNRQTIVDKIQDLEHHLDVY